MSFIDHLIGSPLGLASEDYAPKAWKKYSDIPALRAPEISFTQGRATSVDFGKKVVTSTNSFTRETWDEQYDYLIVSTGLRREWPTVPQALMRQKYLSEVLKHGRLAREARECVVVIGGGYNYPSPSSRCVMTQSRSSRHRNGRGTETCCALPNSKTNPFPHQTPLFRTITGRLQRPNNSRSSQTRRGAHSRSSSQQHYSDTHAR